LDREIARAVALREMEHPDLVYGIFVEFNVDKDDVVEEIRRVAADFGIETSQHDPAMWWQSPEEPYRASRGNKLPGIALTVYPADPHTTTCRFSLYLSKFKAPLPPAVETAFDDLESGRADRVLDAIESALITDVNCMDAHGESLLHYAARINSIDVVAALVDAGADVNGPEGEHTTPLEEAVHQGSFESAELLLSRGANINYQSPGKHTVLYRLVDARPNHVSQRTAVEWLLRHGADKTLKNWQGRTPEQEAREGEFTEMANLIRDWPTGQPAGPGR